MRYALPACVALLAILASGCEPETACTGASGQVVYARFCASCHGDDLQGWSADPTRRGPGLAGAGLRSWWVEMTRAGSSGRHGEGSEMPSFTPEELNDGDMVKIYDHVLDGETAGASLYLSVCGSCHGTTPDQGGKGPALSGPKLEKHWAAAIEEGIHNATSFAMAPMPLCAGDLTAVTEYLARGVQ